MTDESIDPENENVFKMTPNLRKSRARAALDQRQRLVRQGRWWAVRARATIHRSRTIRSAARRRVGVPFASAHTTGRLGQVSRGSPSTRVRAPQPTPVHLRKGTGERRCHGLTDHAAAGRASPIDRPSSGRRRRNRSLSQSARARGMPAINFGKLAPQGCSAPRRLNETSSAVSFSKIVRIADPRVARSGLHM